MCQGYGVVNAIIALSLGHSGMVPYMYFYLCFVIFIYVFGFYFFYDQSSQRPPFPFGWLNLHLLSSIINFFNEFPLYISFLFIS